MINLDTDGYNSPEFGGVKQTPYEDAERVKLYTPNGDN